MKMKIAILAPEDSHNTEFFKKKLLSDLAKP